MKKIIIILIALMMLSGCTIKVDLDVLKDDSVSETVVISQDKSSYSKDIDIDSVVNNYLEIYKDSLTGYKYEDVSTDDLIKFKLNKKYDDIYSYLKESIFVKNNSKDLVYDDVNNTNKVSVNVNAFDCDEECFEPPLIDELVFTISSNKIIDNNADQISGNKYTWNLSSLTESNDINFTIKKANKYNFTKNNSFIKLTLSILVSICILGLICFILYKKYRKNRIKF